MRVRSERPARGGSGWIHLFDAAQPSAPPDSLALRPSADIERAPIDRRHRAYTALLSALVLEDAQRAGLMRRGLPPREILRLGYKSTPGVGFAANAARAIASSVDLRGVPGFYFADGRWRVARMPPGFLVPYRDECGRVEALQIRRWPHDDGDKYRWLSSKGRPLGSSSGSPVHFARPELLNEADEVVITEGALKADAISYLTQSPIIAGAGVSNFPTDFATRLRQIFPALHAAIVAFDRDMLEKPQVFQSLERLTAQLAGVGFEVRVRTWPPPTKGYDDYLLSRLTSGGRAA
jgi:hypothetical protein